MVRERTLEKMGRTLEAVDWDGEVLGSILEAEIDIWGSCQHRGRSGPMANIPTRR